MNDVADALSNGQIQAFVTDTPTAQYMATEQIKDASIVAQFPGGGEYYALLFAKGDPLVACVNNAITAITANGTLASLQHKWLGIYTSIPTIKP